ncbi:hypothetical protein Vadar_007993 [Vaccinium darrowii]|uniref:Uncharacterized protein n=1 Tax=Vaccinium darrowii TaxID=229202 RepID=A0ACB7ZJ86_9ERIC|nr:hypothetical protein Vadar_007993 [Vaccinium darrowii]
MNLKTISCQKKNTISTKTNHRNHRRRLLSPCTLYISILLILPSCIFLVLVFESRFLRTPSPSSQPSLLPYAWGFIHQLKNVNAFATDATCSTADDKLRGAVTFLPLKDLRYEKTAEAGHTWFMSSMNDTREEGEVQYQQFPSESSNGRLLCIKGRDTHDGVWNSYALAWPETLPYNATLMKALTFISNNHYGHNNIWHGLSAMFPFVAWHIKNGCSMDPTRWVLFYKGELRKNLALWVTNILEATFSRPLEVETFDSVGGDGGGGGEAVCFEKAVVMRHNEGGMLRERREEVYDLIRCKAREYCNVSSAAAEGGGGGGGGIGMTLLMRTGARSFRNETVVGGIFEKECKKVEGCRLTVARSDNLTFCEQVKLMSMTDILVSPHGAQLTNLFLMDKNSSVMEFFPKGWLEVAGVGQFIYRWMASWSGMLHRGYWRDPDGASCPYPDKDRRCMSIYKNGQIGYNKIFFGEWATSVLNDVKQMKMVKGKEKSRGTWRTTTIDRGLLQANGFSRTHQKTASRPTSSIYDRPVVPHLRSAASITTTSSSDSRCLSLNRSLNSSVVAFSQSNNDRLVEEHVVNQKTKV